MFIIGKQGLNQIITIEKSRSETVRNVTWARRRLPWEFPFSSSPKIRNCCSIRRIGKCQLPNFVFTISALISAKCIYIDRNGPLRYNKQDWTLNMRWFLSDNIWIARRRLHYFWIFEIWTTPLTTESILRKIIYCRCVLQVVNSRCKFVGPRAHI